MAGSGVPSIAQTGLAMSRYTHLVNALLVAGLFWMGAISFKKAGLLPQTMTWGAVRVDQQQALDAGADSQR